jgi:hypothetical protein
MVMAFIELQTACDYGEDSLGLCSCLVSILAALFSRKHLCKLSNKKSFLYHVQHKLIEKTNFLGGRKWGLLQICRENITRHIAIEFVTT